jgi:hypothetical protein
MTSESNRNSAFAEGQKLFHDTFKHLTTLSTGSILLLATFVKDVFQNPESSFLLGICFFLLITSTVASVLVMMIFAKSVQHSGQPPDTDRKVGSWGMVISAFTFLCGIIVLTIFALINFY